ncbi:MAG: DNA polymerase III subunit gamma/tau [Candidatus Gracilibacteria bacterium]|jgi:DNA polymerase-3 subunit gamma/tau
MEGISLYRKYRPHNFDNLVGQDNIKTTLINAFTNNKVSHAYLLSGPRGTGKTSTARLIAKALNCLNLKDNYEPCNECELCNDINSGNLIDLIEIDAASNRGIDEVRDLKEKIDFSPTRSKYKVYIIDEVHMMTAPAFNALLKTLEEPPAHAYFILATTEIHKIPETIISRCQRFDFKRISMKALLTRLSYIAQMEEIVAEEEALQLISKYVDGGLRDAIGLLEQLSSDKKLLASHVQEILGTASFTLLNEVYDYLIAKDSKNALRIIQQLHSQGSDLKQFTNELLDLLRDKMLASVEKNDMTEARMIMNMIDLLSSANTKTDTDIPQLPLEIAMIKITCGYEEPKEHTPEKIIKNPVENKTVVEKPSIVKEKAPVVSAVESSENDNSSVPFNFEYLQEKWPRITERLKRPSLKMSIKNAQLISVNGISVNLQFDTNFHKDKVMEQENRAELEETIKEIFKKPVKIQSTVKELDLKPVMDEETAPKADLNNFASAAFEVFGGDVK